MKIEKNDFPVINDMTIARGLEEKGMAYLDPRIFFIQGPAAYCDTGPAPYCDTGALQ